MGFPIPLFDISDFKKPLSEIGNRDREVERLPDRWFGLSYTWFCWIGKLNFWFIVKGSG